MGVLRGMRSEEDDEACTRTLRLRLALLRQRIDANYALVATLPASDERASSDDEFSRILVHDGAFPSWRGEGVVVWHRRCGLDAYAVQAKCPHGAISLEASDIEDLSLDFPSTRGPCIACPAHMFVFDLGNGRCLTDTVTPRARTYPVRRSGPHTGEEGGESFYGLWLGRTPCEHADGGGREDAGEAPSSCDCADAPGPPDLTDGNAIQLRLVAKGLRRRFGEEEEEEEEEVPSERDDDTG